MQRNSEVEKPWKTEYCTLKYPKGLDQIAHPQRNPSGVGAAPWSVAARKDDVSAADQAAITGAAVSALFSLCGGLIQTTSG
jgi:hypothetical protein